jgi:hypothetical protein
MEYEIQWKQILAAFAGGDLEKARKLYDDVADKAWKYDGLIE